VLQKSENELVLGYKSTDRDRHEQRKMRSKSLRSGQTSKGKRGVQTKSKSDFFHCNPNRIRTTMEVTVLSPSFDWKLKFVLDSLLI
jgi:hypothetical protein